MSLRPLALLVVVLISCEGSEGPAGINTLVNTTDEPAGANCPAGGLKVEIGPDSNANDVLDANEVKSIKYICDGLNGKNSLVKTTVVDPGDECLMGGMTIDVGVDMNEDGDLEETEIQSTQLICNGKDAVQIEEVRFQLVSLTAIGSLSATGDLSPGWMHLMNFDKGKYLALTKARFLAYISTEGSSVGSTTTAELYNVTDDVPIAGSAVSTTSSTRVWITSEDFLANIPNKEVEIAIKVRTTGTAATCVQAYLVLSKD